MDINYLQNIVTELSLIDPSMHREAERLKIKTINAFKQIFPEDATLLRSIEKLRFDMYYNMPNEYLKDEVLNSINKLKATLEVKIEVLKFHSANKTLQELEQSNQYNDRIIKQQERTIEQYRIELMKADERLTHARNNQAGQEARIKTLEAQARRSGFITKLRNGTSIGIIITLIGGIFTTGYYAGNTKFDRDKIQLSDENRSFRDSIIIYNKGIEYMRKNSDSALNAIASMPYHKMKLDTSEFRLVQSTIDKGGALLNLNKNYEVEVP